MDYYGNNDWRDYLAHYGVKGMKWKNHKYVNGLKDFIDYKITGHGYLRDADKHTRQSNLFKNKAGTGVYLKGPKKNDHYLKKSIDHDIAAENSYWNYGKHSLGGKLNRQVQKITKKKRIPDYLDYTNNRGRYNNLSSMLSTRRELKKRQRKEKAKNLVNKILGKKYNSSPANSQKPLQTESFIREQFVREKKIKEKKK